MRSPWSVVALVFALSCLLSCYQHSASGIHSVTGPLEGVQSNKVCPQAEPDLMTQNSASLPTAVSSPPTHPRGRDGMVLLAGASFQMGSNRGRENEKPVHTVEVSSFWMDTTPVTTQAYRACVDARKCTSPDMGDFCNWGKEDRENHPINCVSWEQATDYCRWVGKRLPTEEEWEFAARGPNSRTYPWGEAQPSNQLCWNGQGNTLGESHRKSTCPVGSFPAGDTPTGLKDMGGNVFEWTSSVNCPYTKSGYDIERCTTVRSHRGGSWMDPDSFWVRGATRDESAAFVRGSSIGFRCVQNL